MKAFLRLIGFGAFLAATGAFAASTVPVGGMSVNIVGGSVAGPFTTSFSIPLLDTPGSIGAGVGRITSVTSTTITSTGAGWTSGALASAAAPYACRITSGAAAGVTFTITANTEDTISTTEVDLSTLGLIAGASGDSFRLIPVDTLFTLFGSNTLLGATNSTDADIVTLSRVSQLSYYYNTSLNQWVRTTGLTTNRNNIPIPQDTVVSITRKSSGMTLRFPGRVPDVRFKLAVPNAGTLYTHTGFPTDVTLGVLSLQTALPGWVSSASSANADTLTVGVGVTSLTYFHNGTNWQRTSGLTTNRDSISIAAGTPIIIFKRGNASGVTYWTRNLPYSF